MARLVDASHLANDRHDVAKLNYFEMVIENFGDDAVKDDLVMAVESCTLPTVGNEVIEIADGNGVTKVLGGRTVSGGSMVLRDFVTPNVELQAYKWHEKANPRVEGSQYNIAKISDYKYNAVIYQYHAGSVLRKWYIYGIIPTEFNFGELSKDSRGDIKKVELTLEYDDAEPDKGDGTGLFTR